MNNLAISPYIGMHILQLQNIKRNYTSSYSAVEPPNADVVLVETTTATVATKDATTTATAAPDADTIKENVSETLINNVCI